MDENRPFQWQRHPQAERFLLKLLEEAQQANPAIRALEEGLSTTSSTRLFDWLDHFILEGSGELQTRLEALDFIPQHQAQLTLFLHRDSTLPAVITRPGKEEPAGIALRVDSIAHFLQCNGLQGEIRGEPLAPLRRCCATPDCHWALYAVERRGGKGYLPTTIMPYSQAQYLESQEQWQTIRRTAPTPAEEKQLLSSLVDTAEHLIETLGRDTAAHVICQAERGYWMARNRVARIQKMRQDILGMGWANHDHHTFRSSRRHFAKLVEFFSLLGFERRERFYAGKEAGWGAQVMENRDAGLSLFLDVDLAPEEVALDFSTQGLEEREELGTVGLWCGLHGDSILAAGMHHLAANCLFELLPQDLHRYQTDFMAPFSDFDYLKQSFSRGEIWEVAPSRVQALVERRAITPAKAEQFLSKGVIGSHLENIQRREGYKGFNKNNVNLIIRGTDPRRYQQ
ncbi:hypothetical protein [Desulfogranum mediterraneum]|uniref:hypothetical protein n=1 Tax=Desulfogranum mediterraneum TaxID=160661 RepID=UPI0004041E73|nr:hypothetical protein [Desulfogranum mediterraneum]